MKTYNYIYLITNKINGKIYIGKHSTDKHNSESDTFIRKELMRRYIQDYELEDMIKINKYKK